MLCAMCPCKYRTSYANMWFRVKMSSYIVVAFILSHRFWVYEPELEISVSVIFIAQEPEIKIQIDKILFHFLYSLTFQMKHETHWIHPDLGCPDITPFCTLLCLNLDSEVEKKVVLISMSSYMSDNYLMLLCSSKHIFPRILSLLLCLVLDY